MFTNQMKYLAEVPVQSPIFVTKSTMNPDDSPPMPAGLNTKEPPDYVDICVASPETIRGWSSGEVTSGETIDYKKLKPVENGLYCETIFGRVSRARLFVWEDNWENADWECDCRAYRGIEHRGVICNYKKHHDSFIG